MYIKMLDSIIKPSDRKQLFSLEGKEYVIVSICLSVCLFVIGPVTTVLKISFLMLSI